MRAICYGIDMTTRSTESDYIAAALAMGLTAADWQAYYDWTKRVNPPHLHYHTVPTGKNMAIELQIVATLQARAALEATGDA